MTENPDKAWRTWIDTETIHDGPSWALILAVPALALVLLAALALVVAR